MYYVYAISVESGISVENKIEVENRISVEKRKFAETVPDGRKDSQIIYLRQRLKNIQCLGLYKYR